MKRMNFRQLLFVGRDETRQSKFGSRIYIVGSRARTVYFAWGPCDFENRRCYPKWLHSKRKVFKTEAAAAERVQEAIDSHKRRGYSNLKARQKANMRFQTGGFVYERIDGSIARSTDKGSG